MRGFCRIIGSLHSGNRHLYFLWGSTINSLWKPVVNLQPLMSDDLSAMMVVEHIETGIVDSLMDSFIVLLLGASAASIQMIGKT